MQVAIGYSLLVAAAAASAWSISASRSAGVSSPTDRRTSPSGTGLSAPSTGLRCSIRLSTPPSEVAWMNTLVAAAKRRAASNPHRAGVEVGRLRPRDAGAVAVRDHDNVLAERIIGGKVLEFTNMMCLYITIVNTSHPSKTIIRIATDS